MAMMIRDQYHLLTLRCSLEYELDPRAERSREGQAALRRSVHSQLFEGKVALGEPQSTPVEHFGIFEGGKAAQTPHSLAGSPIEGQVRQAAALDSGGVLWFHVPQDSFELALLPWEEMVWAVARMPLLHIANFLSDPYTPCPEPRIAVCASQPLADGRFDVGEYVLALLEAIDAGAGVAEVSPRVTVYTDSAWRASVAHRVAAAACQRLVVDGVPEPPQSLSREGDREGENPWLRWICEGSSGEPVDIVHFVSPGYFHERRGSIAVAAAPHDNQSPGQFIGAGELAGLYDRLGCSVMAFSSPDMPQWEWGQRILGFELSWLRPGPILVMEHDRSAYPSLARYYAMLLGGGRDALRYAGEGAPIHLSCHPRLLEPRAHSELFKAAPPLETAAGLEQPWQAKLSRQIAQTRAKLEPTREMSPTETWQADGTRAALDFVEGLMNQTRDRGEEHMVATP